MSPGRTILLLGQMGLQFCSEFWRNNFEGIGSASDLCDAYPVFFGDFSLSDFFFQYGFDNEEAGGKGFLLLYRHEKVEEIVEFFCRFYFEAEL